MTSTAPSSIVTRLTAALGALAALLVVILGVPAVMISIGAVPRSAPSLHAVVHSLTSGDNTGLYFRIAGAAVVWICWALFTATTVKEALASVHRRGQRPVFEPHGAHRLGPRRLVAAIAILFVATPATLALSVPHAWSTPPPTPATHTVAALADADPNIPVQAGTHHAHHGETAPTYVVQRYDTLWSIAQRHLRGSPALRYRDIAALNPALIGPDNRIVTGTTLTMPGDAFGLTTTTEPVTRASTEVTVRRGDTLSGLSTEHGIANWTEVWEQNRDRAEPHGERFTDPDMLQPGWTITIDEPTNPQQPTPATVPTSPADAAPPTVPVPATSPSSHSSAAPENATAPPTATAPPSDAGSPSESAANPTPVPRSTVSAPGEVRDDWRPWEAVFGGAGALLAAGLLRHLIVERHRQARYRRPGRTVPPTPTTALSAEKALRFHAPAAAAGVEFLDLALRSLCAETATSPTGTLPECVAASLDADTLSLYLTDAHPTDPPAPWSASEDGMRWDRRADAPLPLSPLNARDVLAPYPTLVTIGNDRDGRTWLLDLEGVGVLRIVGDPDRGRDLARFFAAELAVNAWSDHVEVTVVGLGTDIELLEPSRLRVEDDLPDALTELSDAIDRSMAAASAAGVDVLTGRLRQVLADRWMPHLLIAATPDAATLDNADELDEVLARSPRRAPGAAVLVSCAGIDLAGERWTLELTREGRLLVPAFGLDLQPHQLPAEQVTPLAQLLACAAELSDAPMPAAAGELPYQQFSDAAGAIRAEFTLPRQPAGDCAAEDRESSVLPLDDAIYLDRAATTTADLNALAPRMALDTAAKIRAADPTLDDDVAAWHDPHCQRPRLRLLGPVELRAHGERTADVARRIAYYTELVAYLATRDHGATAEQIADAFNIATSTTYSRLATLKSWLGRNPNTGDRYLPDATQSPAARARGIGIYQLDGVLVDADLFKRLRLRGQAAGAAGINDLQTALTLVTGAPFDQLRGGGYEWLTERDRFDHIYTEAIVDVAHIVATHHLCEGDLAVARFAVEVALRAAPYEETPHLDMIAVRQAEGATVHERAQLINALLNHVDDGEAPLDSPERTGEILRHHGWTSRGLG